MRCFVLFKSSNIYKGFGLLFLWILCKLKISFWTENSLGIRIHIVYKWNYMLIYFVEITEALALALAHLWSAAVTSRYADTMFISRNLRLWINRCMLYLYNSQNCGCFLLVCLFFLSGEVLGKRKKVRRTHILTNQQFKDMEIFPVFKIAL